MVNWKKYEPREIIRAEVKTDAMEPVIGRGALVVAEPVPLGHVTDGAVVIMEWVDGRGARHQSCRRLSREGPDLFLRPDKPGASAWQVWPGQVEWVAVVLFPARDLTIHI